MKLCNNLFSAILNLVCFTRFAQIVHCVLGRITSSGHIIHLCACSLIKFTLESTKFCGIIHCTDEQKGARSCFRGPGPGRSLWSLHFGRDGICLYWAYVGTDGQWFGCEFYPSFFLSVHHLQSRVALAFHWSYWEVYSGTWEKDPITIKIKMFLILECGKSVCVKFTYPLFLISRVKKNDELLITLKVKKDNFNANTMYYNMYLAVNVNSCEHVHASEMRISFHLSLFTVILILNILGFESYISKMTINRISLFLKETNNHAIGTTDNYVVVHARILNKFMAGKDPLAVSPRSHSAGILVLQIQCEPHFPSRSPVLVHCYNESY